MSPEGATLGGDGAEYSFAMEYHGPPITHDIPRAVPIKVGSIPVAAVVSQIPLSEKLSLPVVQPISTRDITKKFSKELKLGSESIVSPTSVIAFEGVNSEGDDSKELAVGSETTVSPTYVIAFEERASNNGDFVMSGELSSLGNLDFRNSHEGSGEFSDVIHSSTGLGSSSTSHEHSHEFLGTAGSSGTLGFLDSFDKSTELMGNPSAHRVSNGCEGSLDFNDSNQLDWVSSKSVLSLDYPSSRGSLRIGDGNNEPACDVRRTPVVTFRDIKSDEGDFDEELSRSSEPEIVRGKREPEVKARKGACYRCSKGNKFTEKEACIVCDAKYCSNCVLRAMGSMPEGRKCVTCIGSPIDESRRGNLGKCSRMLKRQLNDLEIRQILKAEKFCEVNQLPPEYVFVNGKPLCQEELALLQSCPNPPKKLKPGYYWYDKVSGLWGKEGQKPSKIISPHLNVGGPIKADASNGNTQVFINGREITKVELRMLQLSGVQCAGNPHFWVNEDGSYQEEGQKNTRGYIWGKAGTKLVCAALSLPFPSKSANPHGEEQVNNLVSRAVPDYIEQRTLQKLLLIGYSGSGMSTIFKQAKILYKDVPFSEYERENIKLLIQSNVYGYLGILLEGRERFEDESLNETRKNQFSDESGPSGNTHVNEGKNMYSICPRLKAFSDWLLKIMVSGSLEAIFPAATREYAPFVRELWNNAAIQATYRRRSELELLPSVASFFLERAVDILRLDYEPSDVDILHAEGVMSSNGLACLDFSFPQPAHDIDIDTADQLDSLLRYQLIRVQARGFGENCKWLEMFEDVRIVIFCVALSDYDQNAIDGDGTLVNKMLLTKKFFETIVTHPTFDQMDFLLILNKFDLFEKKLEQVPLTQCDWFDDFDPVMSRHSSNSSRSNSPSLGQLAFHYIAVKFKRLYSSLTDRKLYVASVKGLEPESVDEALKYAREILKWDEERPNFSLSEYSIYSTEASSFSH